MKSEFVRKLFDNISNNYDKLNNIMTFGLHNLIKKDVFENLSIKEPKKILDLCTGTGDIAFILHKKYPTAEIVGMDFSQKMLEIAKKKHQSINFVQGNCMGLPFEGESFDACTISFGLRNVENIEKVVDEIHRVLKKGGVFVNLDLGKPNKFFNFFLKPYMYIWVAFLGKVFHGDETPYRYLAESNEDFPSPEKLVKIYEKAGFKELKKKDYLFGQISMQRGVK